MAMCKWSIRAMPRRPTQRTLAAMELLPVVESIGRVVAGGVLLIAGAAKLRIGPRSFAYAIRAYRLVPGRLATPAAHAIPVLELVIGITLLTGTLVRISALAGALLLVAFSLAIAIALARGQRNACGCGLAAGAGRDAISRRILARNAVLTALLVVTSISTEGME